MISREINDLLVLLRANEIAISRLYHQYALSFPEDAGFWNEMSVQEVSHGQDIDQLRDLAGQGKILAGKTTLRAQAVQTNIRYINALIEDCGQGKLPRKKAYALALDLENALLEKKFFDIFDFTRTGPYTDIRAKLVAETQLHRERIAAKLKEQP
ncbi:MAG: hypothetical protein JXB25_06675 [Deltaproteobacteria bacterium]|nr:hypothetical protein [Deltaproteobacteria bacterium]